MKAKNLEDVVVYREAVEVANAISSLLERPAFGKYFDTKDQLGRSSRRVAPLIAEGFGQLTDRHSAKYITIGKRLTRWIQHLRRSDWKARA